MATEDNPALYTVVIIIADYDYWNKPFSRTTKIVRIAGGDGEEVCNCRCLS